MGLVFEGRRVAQASLMVLCLILTTHHNGNGYAYAFAGMRPQPPHDLPLSTSFKNPRPATFPLLSTAQNHGFGSHKDDDDDDDEEEQDLVNQEQFYRDLMGIPLDDEENKKSKRPNKNKDRKKRPHDNRDQLPFLVQVITPPKEPYQAAFEPVKMKKKKKGKKGFTTSSDEGVIIGETLGEFQLDKHTNCGDKIEIDNEVYVVQRSKCQYKYAGAQKFVMVRKVLQVKPVERVMQEEYILRQWNAGEAPESS